MGAGVGFWGGVRGEGWCRVWGLRGRGGRNGQWGGCWWELAGWVVGGWEVGVIVVGARSVVIGGGWLVERGRGGMGGEWSRRT